MSISLQQTLVRNFMDFFHTFNATEEFMSVFLIVMSRSSRSQMFFKIGVFKKIREFHRKTPVMETLVDKVAVATLLKRHSNTGVFL